MDYITVVYALKMQFKPIPHYKVTECGKVFNCRTGREIKGTINGGSKGYWIQSKFYTLSKFQSQLEEIHKQTKLPF